MRARLHLHSRQLLQSVILLPDIQYRVNASKRGTWMSSNDREPPVGEGAADYERLSLTQVAQRADDFFMGVSPIHQAMRRLCDAMNQLQIPFAIAGAMAANAHGHRRTTADINILFVARISIDSRHSTPDGAGSTSLKGQRTFGIPCVT